MKKILIIEDEENIRKTIARLLTGAGYKTVQAPSAEVGLGFLSTIDIDLIIIDIILPGQEGLGTIRMLRREGNQTPIVAITGVQDKTYLQMASHLGANATMAKPFEGYELLKLVVDLLEQGESQ
ncbi:MAG TPA: response regulator [Calditrichia bacterium]|nr:response regulator [Calditrichota bacterium]HQU74274.1 response regulator [Calditrichia bacterium]HQV31613.1 response regulator [Calditrichia bacterium]